MVVLFTEKRKVGGSTPPLTTPKNFPDIEVVQGRDEVLDEGVELAAGYPHVGMRRLHAEAGVGARSAATLAQLVDELLGQPLQVGPGELLVDAVVLRGAIFKGAGNPAGSVTERSKPVTRVECEPCL